MIKEIVKQALTGSQDFPLSTHIFGVPWEVMMVAVLILVVGVIAFWFNGSRNEHLQKFWTFVWLEYTILGYCSTVVFRLTRETREVKTDLFWGYEDGFHQGTTFPENFLNVLFFIPIGYLACLMLSRHRLLFSGLVGLALSLLIESSQFVFKKGAFDVDDLLNNTLGAVLGCLMCLFFFVEEKN